MKRQSLGSIIQLKNGIAILSLMSMLGACKQNPFPKTGGNVQPNEEIPNPVVPAYSIDVESFINCLEGAECSSPIVAHVPAGGSPVLRFEGLPEGASFDQSLSRIIYHPNYDTIKIADDTSQTVKTFVVTAILRSDADPVTTYKKLFSINVKNVLRPITIEAENLNPSVLEGQTFSQLLTLRSEDFPAGPFYLNFHNQPEGLRFTPVVGRPTQFMVSYTPSYFVVTPQDPFQNGRYVKRFPMSVLVTTPSGQSVSQSLTWTVLDQRLAPHVSAPAQITQGPNVNFTVRAVDLNGEREPIVQINPVVPFGTLQISKLESTPGVPGVSLPTALFNVQWVNIPYNKIGETHDINALICGPSTATLNTICVNTRTSVTLSGSTHSAPIVDRSNWPPSKIQYFKMGTPFVIPLSIRDAEISGQEVEIEILPTSMSSFVKYRNGNIEISPAAEGFGQFSVKATSQYQQTTMESFLFDALPSNWSDKLILSGTKINDEVRLLRDYAQSGDVLSSLFQLSERNLQLRRVLIVTTDALSELDAIPFIEKAASAVSDIVILSPLVGSAGRLTEELTGLGANIASRLNSPLSMFTVVANPTFGFAAPQLPMGLNGKISAESARPQIIEKTESSRCERLFSLQKPATDHSVGLRCPRENGGSFTAVGFEFSDLVVGANDVATVTSWFNKITQMDAGSF